jgi:hypothetical protein
MAGDLQPPEQVLLFLALINSTGSVIWHDPFHISTNETQDMALIEGNMHKTLSAVYKLNELSVCATFEIPKFVCSRHGDTNTVMGLLRAVEAWELAIDDFTNRKSNVDAAQKLLRIEMILERLLRMQKQKPDAFAKKLADWAVVSAEFPTYEIVRGHTQWICAEYWREMIRRCVLGVRLIEIPSDDLIDLIEYCEEEIPHGSIYAATLMTILRQSVRKQREYLGLPAHKGIRVFSIVPATAEEHAQHANDIARLKQMALVAPENKPERKDFLDTFVYLRAISRWEAAQTLKNMEVEVPGSTSVPTPVTPATPTGYATDYESDV